MLRIFQICGALQNQTLRDFQPLRCKNISLADNTIKGSDQAQIQVLIREIVGPINVSFAVSRITQAGQALSQMPGHKIVGPKNVTLAISGIAQSGQALSQMSGIFCLTKLFQIISMSTAGSEICLRQGGKTSMCWMKAVMHFCVFNM